MSRFDLLYGTQAMFERINTQSQMSLQEEQELQVIVLNEVERQRFRHDFLVQSGIE
jgi:hypothetical protein